MVSSTFSLGVLSHKQSSFIKECLLIAVGSVLISLSALVSIKLPFTPVPIALAPHLCLAMGALLGSKRGAIIVLAYLLQGISGLPVFALGDSGLLHLFGPRGGYLIGYVAATYFTGHLIERIRDKAGYKFFLAFSAGNGIIYLFGILQLSLFVGFKAALLLGMVPFLFSDLLKILVIYKGLKHYLMRVSDGKNA